METLLESAPHRKHYLQRYVKLIKHWQQQILTEDCERHHICPKSMFPEYGDGRRNPWNIVKLTPRQHFIAHWLLWKIYENRPMAFAFAMMTRRGKSGRIFEAAKIAISRVGEVCSEETKRKMSEAAKRRFAEGKVMSGDGRKRLSEFARNRSPELREKMGAPHRGKTISAEMRAKQSAALAGEKNPRALRWTLTFEDGSPSQEITGFKAWCRERGLNYTTFYMRHKRGNKNFLNGIRAELKPD